MPERPILLLPQPVVGKRHTRNPGRGNIFTPPPAQQRDRLVPQIQRLEETFRIARETALRDNPAGVQPEKVLVLETVGRVDDFVRAIRGLPGLEWLTEWDEFEI